MGDTTIAWTNKSWGPVRGCAMISAGCQNCYAQRMAHRFSGPGQPYDGLTRATKHGPAWTGRARFIPEKLGEPLTWRKARRVFVNSMSDLFHEDISDEQIAAVFGVMAACPQHTFQVLTKRPERMRAWFAWVKTVDTGLFSRKQWPRFVCAWQANKALNPDHHPLMDTVKSESPWPLPNVHLGVSVEDQATADERIPLLLQVPAAVRFLSLEPLLEAVDLTPYLGATLTSHAGERMKHPDSRIPNTGGTWDFGIDWVIPGGESGPGARPCDVAWIRSVVRQCREAGTACFVKQLGAKPYGFDALCGASNMMIEPLRDRAGADPDEWPDDLRVRQYPEVTR